LNNVENPTKQRERLCAAARGAICKTQKARVEFRSGAAQTQNRLEKLESDSARR
jgi:hypothetical protein